MNKYVMTAASLVLLAACHSNPYSGVKGNLDPKPPQPKPTPINNFYVDLESTSVDVLENATLQVKVKGVVPKGDPILRYDNLPPFVTKDAAGTTLTIAPGFGDATDPKHADEGVAIYKVDIYLSSTDSPATSIPPTTLNILVHNVPRGLAIANFNTFAQPEEGQAFATTFDVQSLDYPNGPFTVSGSNLPVGMEIVPTGNPTKFMIKYSAPYTTVKTSNYTTRCSGRICLEIGWTLTVIDPHGSATSQSATWRVVDVRQNPVVVSPTNVTGALPNADFYLTVEDPNGETVPQVTATVPAGTQTLTSVASSPGSATSNPYVMQHVQWTGNPTSSKGTSQTMNVQSCVFGSPGMMNQCVTTPVNVQF